MNIAYKEYPVNAWIAKESIFENGLGGVQEGSAKLGRHSGKQALRFGGGRGVQLQANWEKGMGGIVLRLLGMEEGTMKLKGQTALVTGAGRGIGRAIARRFAAEGCAVALSARTKAEVEAVAREIEAAGGRATAIVADLATEAGCGHLVEAARAGQGPIDILVNNAGIYGPVAPVEEISAAEWDAVMAINLRAPFLLLRLVLPEMYARRRGAVVNISSVAGKGAFAWNSPYAASKAAINGLTRTIAAEAGRKGVRVNAISPGPVPETKMSQELGQGLARRVGGDPEKIFKDFLESLLQGRPQTTEEIAAAAVFLASSESSAITGQVLNVDGGMSFC